MANSNVIPITGSMLYDMRQCEHRPYMDVFGNSALRDSPDDFVELLWETGQAYEEDVVASLGITFVSYATEDVAELFNPIISNLCKQLLSL